MMEIINFTDNIKIFRAKSLNVNSILISKKNNYIIDTLLFPKDSREIKTYLKSEKIDLDFIINTHYHSDHCYGNKILYSRDIQIIGHKKFQHTIDAERKLVISKSGRKISKKEIVTPDLVFEDEYRIDDIFILHTPGHSKDSCSVFLPNEKVLLTGDLVINSVDDKYALPYFYWDNIDDMITSLETILRLNFDTIIPGHGNITNKEKIKLDLDYLYNFKNFFFEARNTKDIEKISKIDIQDFLSDKSLKIWNKDIHRYNLKNQISKF